MSKAYVPANSVPMISKYSDLEPLYDAAWQVFGVQLGYFRYDSKYPDRVPKPGYYAVVCPDTQTMSALQKGIVPLETVLKDNETKHPSEVMCYYNVTYLSDINPKNAFRKVRAIEKALRNVSTAKYAFTEYGYDLPKSVTQATLDGFARYNNIRRARDLDEATRNQYEQVMKKSVAYANELYNKDNFSGVTLVPMKKKESQLVTREFFDKRHIACSNDVVDEGFWRFLQEHMPEKPDFVIYKDKKPSLVLKDNSKYDGPGVNIWEAQKEYKEYNVTFSSGMNHEFYTWMLEYKTRKLLNVANENDLLENSSLMYPIQIPYEDLKLFDMYCKENGDIKYCINHGLFGENGPEETRTPIIGIRSEDARMIGAILREMSRNGSQELVYSAAQWKALDSLPNASYANPYLTEYQKQNNDITR